MTVSTLGPVQRTKVRPEGRQPVTSTYNELLGQIRSQGLLERRRGFYILVFALLTAGLGGAIAGFVLLGDSWFQLLIAGALGIIFTQFAFLAHEASHRQIFASGPVNDRVGRFLATWMVGMSYQWWMTKHTRHHANPNTVGKDPDIEFDTISFTEEDAAKQKGLMAAMTRRQGYFFFPLLMLEGVNLHVTSVRSLMERRPTVGRSQELTAIAVRLTVYLGLVFLFLPLGMAFAFLGVQLAVFGVYMGASFAPNHKGMPLLPTGSRVDFLSKQVLTSRNIKGGWWMNALMGGLNHQVEHHLFPSMPRPSLARARELTRVHCATHGIPYTETSLVRSYAIVIEYLNRVGLAARDPFDCPAAGDLRRR
ncbi:MULTISPECIES: fatty acid desaturase family protein [Leifsonia]|jgi:fatty acid desaturase|uniref:fatty acid desaturase family protein n=1 Tax=Leifsonia TaxID=110932 RepID=UPI00092C68BC|nr:MULTISPECIES: acyl-CoA desaturase [Leifsonia]OJX73177.1 MAG: acyl-CoA desaturase [Leifsonia sp. 71-9]